MLLLSEKSKPYLSYKNTCKLTPQKIWYPSVDITWSRGGSNGSGKNLKFSYFAGAKIDRKVIKQQKSNCFFGYYALSVLNGMSSIRY